MTFPSVYDEHPTGLMVCAQNLGGQFEARVFDEQPGPVCSSKPETYASADDALRAAGSMATFWANANGKERLLLDPEAPQPPPAVIV